MFRLHDFLASGNGYKCRLLLHHLGLPFERIEVDILRGESRTDAFARLNPELRIPVLELPDGTALPESNAILCYLAEGTPWLPAEGLARAQVMRWLFWEQYSHEPNVATVRHWVIHPANDEDRRRLLPQKRAQGARALAVMERHLAGRGFFVGEGPTVADLALYAYTHVAPEGGFDLGPYPSVRAWLARVAALPGHVTIDHAGGLAQDARARSPRRGGAEARMRCIGLVGGMSWESTAHYYRALNEGVRARLGGMHSARLVLHSVEFAEIEAMQREGRWEDAGRVLREAVRGLEGAGADFIVLAANTMHKVADQMMEGAHIPLLHIADVTGETARRAGLGTVGLLATRYTMEEDFYVRRLAERHGLRVLVPGPQDRAEVHRVIFEELVLGVVNPASRARFLAIAGDLKRAGAQGLVAGCTEIGMLLGPGDLDQPLLDTARLHVEAALDLALAVDG